MMTGFVEGKRVWDGKGNLSNVLEQDEGKDINRTDPHVNGKRCLVCGCRSSGIRQDDMAQ